MILYFANRKMNILGLASTELMEGFTISRDLKTEDTDTGVATFECTIHWTDESRALAEACTSAGNYLLRSYDNDNEFYTIIETEVDTKAQSIYIYAEDAGMDLLNETVGAFAADEAHPAEWYILKYAEDTGFEIGINEIENLSRKLEWTGTATAAERIASVATQFDNAEISYSYEIKELTITHKYINIHKKRGKDAGVQLRLNRDVDRIITTTSVADLATALYATGGIPDDSDDPITLEGYVYDDGDMYVEDGLLKSRSALEVWSRYVWAKEPGQIEGYTGHIVKQWSYDTTSQSELCNRAITQLGKVCEPAINYEIDIQMLPENVGIGDYVDIVDEKGELYLSSRILKLTTSACEQEQTATLGEFLIVESGISQTVKELAEQFSQLAKSRQYYVWIVYADDEYGDGISLDPEGKTYMGTCTTSAGPDPDLSDPSIYKWSLIQGVGIEEINTYYGISDSPAVIPTVWQDEPYTELGNNNYQWSYTETIYTNGVIELTSPTIIAYYSYLEVDELVAEVANIESLLAGEAGVGILEAIHLSSANVVIADATITDAMIANITADKIRSGTIYTDYVQIANNTTEEGQFMLIDHSTIQINDGNVMRVQIGEDAEGDYNLYLWDDAGELLWNAKGLTESGVSGNGGIIKDVAVADDAAIQGHKLDIQSVASELSEDGTLTVQAGNVYIGDDRLDYQLTQIEEQIAGLEGVTTEGIVTFYPVYALGLSDTEAPIDNDVNAICGECICGQVLCGQMGSVWTEEQPTQIENYYLWMKYVCIYSDGHTEKTAPILITDSFLRSTTDTIQTSLTVIQGEIEAEIWETEIVGEAITDLYTYVDQTVTSITAEVGAVYTDLETNYATKASLVLQINPETGHAEMIGEADYIYLYGNQIVIQSDNFSLDADGRIVSTSGLIGGWEIGPDGLYYGTDSMSSTVNGSFIGVNGIRQYSDGEYLNITATQVRNGSDNTGYEIRLNRGQIMMYVNSVAAGRLASAWRANDTSILGVALTIEQDSTGFIGLGRQASDSTYNAAYEINYGSNTSYSERHIFYGTARHTGAVYLSSDIPINGYKADGSFETMMYLEANNNYIYVGSSNVPLYLRGSTIYLSGTISSHAYFANGYAIRGYKTGGSYGNMLYMSTNDIVVVGNTDTPLYLYSSDGVHISSFYYGVGTLNGSNISYRIGNLISFYFYGNTGAEVLNCLANYKPVKNCSFPITYRDSGMYAGYLYYNGSWNIRYFTSLGGNGIDYSSSATIYATISFLTS